MVNVWHFVSNYHEVLNTLNVVLLSKCHCGAFSAISYICLLSVSQHHDSDKWWSETNSHLANILTQTNSSLLLFKMQVMVCHFVSCTYEVMTTLILVMLVLLLLEWTKKFLWSLLCILSYILLKCLTLSLYLSRAIRPHSNIGICEVKSWYGCLPLCSGGREGAFLVEQRPFCEPCGPESAGGASLDLHSLGEEYTQPLESSSAWTNIECAQNVLGDGPGGFSGMPAQVPGGWSKGKGTWREAGEYMEASWSCWHLIDW